MRIPPGARIAAIAAAAFLTGVAAALLWGGVLHTDHKASAEEPRIAWKLTRFSALDGWPGSAPERALDAFARSCDALMARPDDAPANMREALGAEHDGASLSGTVADWRAPCAAAQTVLASTPDAAAAKAFFEAQFTPVRILARRGGKTRHDGLFTGYFEPEYAASRTRTEEFSAAVLPRPDDLVEVELGRFRKDLAGRRIAGRVVNGTLVPYPDNAAISGADIPDDPPLAWMRPVDLAFMQIQGSGRVRFGDGTVERLGYAAQNGHPYTAIGRVLVQRGAMPLDAVSMQSIRAWLSGAPRDDARAVLDSNQSYVFFRILTDAPVAALGPLGAQGVQLTPGASLAVDRRYYALGTPIWADARQTEGAGPALHIRQLTIAQDTGGAIRGPIRGDVFVGSGAEAEEMAGPMRAEGELTALLPKALAARLARGS